MHEVDEPPQEIRIGVRKDAVPQVEDVSRPVRSAAQDVARPLGGGIPPGDHACGVQVALHAAVEADALPGTIERLAVT